MLFAQQGTPRETQKARRGGPMRPGFARWTAVFSRLAVVLLLFSLVPAGAQKKKKKDESREQQREKTSDSLVRLPDPQLVDVAISEMMGAWQIGDAELLHKYFAEDVVVVSGAWEAPLIGWNNYLKAYQRQRERAQGMRLERTNTAITVRGNIAWAAYQWDFTAMVDGRQTSARGHTTLVLEKRGDRWLIVHNHTSLVPEVKPPEASPLTAPPKPNPPGL